MKPDAWWWIVRLVKTVLIFVVNWLALRAYPVEGRFFHATHWVMEGIFMAAVVWRLFWPDRFAPYRARCPRKIRVYITIVYVLILGTGVELLTYSLPVFCAVALKIVYEIPAGLVMADLWDGDDDSDEAPRKRAAASALIQALVARVRAVHGEPARLPA